MNSVHIFWTYVSMKCVLFVFWWNMSLLSGCDGQLENLRRVLAANQSWCANSPQKKQKYAMYTAQIYSVTVWKMQNTKYKVQYMKYNVQSHHIKRPIYNALLQYSTMCKSMKEKKVKLWPLLHSCRLSIIRSFQSICIHSVFLVLCIFVLGICIFNPSVFFLLSVFYNLCLHCCSSLL